MSLASIRGKEIKMTYSHVNSKGQTYYLHVNKIERSSGKVTKLYFFSREEKEGKTLDAVPDGYRVIEMKTGLPALKKA